MFIKHIMTASRRMKSHFLNRPNFHLKRMIRHGIANLRLYRFLK